MCYNARFVKLLEVHTKIEEYLPLTVQFINKSTIDIRFLFDLQTIVNRAVYNENMKFHLFQHHFWILYTKVNRVCTHGCMKDVKIRYFDEVYQFSTNFAK